MNDTPPLSSDIGVLRAGWGYASITDKIADLVLTRPVGWRWLLAFCATPVGLSGVYSTCMEPQTSLTVSCGASSPFAAYHLMSVTKTILNR